MLTKTKNSEVKVLHTGWLPVLVEPGEMWATFLLCTFVGRAAADYGWIPGQQYIYNINSTTFTGLHQVSDQYSGVQVTGNLYINVDLEKQLTVQVQNLKYAEFCQYLNEGWETNTAEGNYKNVDEENPPFQIYLNQGMVEKLVVTEGTSQWNLNFFKTIANHLQTAPRDVQGTASYSKKEESIHGKCETYYDISTIPEYIVQSSSEKALGNHTYDGKHIKIAKTRNFLNCDKLEVYSYGLNGHEDWKKGTNAMENILTRSSQTVIHTYGTGKNYTMLSIETVDEVVAAVHIQNSQKGKVVSRIKLTFENRTILKEPSATINKPKIIDNLIYEYGSSQNGGTEFVTSSILDSNTSNSSSRPSGEDFASQVIKILSVIDNYGPHMNNGQLVKSIVKVARHIGKSLNKPSEIYNDEVLNWFVNLTRMAQVASSQTLQQVTEKLYYPDGNIKNTGNQEAIQNYRTWQTYRDAVAQAGTGPALVTLSSWIKSGKVKGNEAAALLAVLPTAARYPTTEYMNHFFELVKSNELQSQKYLNDNAILTFADLVGRFQVYKETTHHRSPINLSRSQSQNHRGAAVAEKYIPYFQRQLESAIEKGDSVKIQVYIRALSNTAHPNILSVFEPYLEGKLPISKFQRFLMVASLDELAREHPNTARSVLYRIYRNQGEDPEVRVAAVMQLMKTNPSVQILQSMAEQTRYDHNKQVNAAVKSAIESVAVGENTLNPQLIQNARAAAEFLSSENFGAQYSKNFLTSYFESEQTRYEQHFAFMQGQYGAYPDAFFHSLNKYIGGYPREPYTVSYLSSGTQQLVNILLKQLNYSSYTAQESNERHNFDFSYVREVLNWEDIEPIQVEGNFLTSFLGGKRFLAFDEKTVERLPEVFREIIEKLEKGFNFQESKFYYRDYLEIKFPLVASEQFTYSFNEPTLAYLGVAGKGHLHQFQNTEPPSKDNWFPMRAGLNGECKLVLSTQRHGSLGFSTPYNGQTYATAYEINAQLYAPLKGMIELNGYNNTIKASMQPLTDKDQLKIFQYKSDIKQILNNNVQYLHVGPKEIFQKSFGRKQTGYTFRIDVNRTKNYLDKETIYNTFYKNTYDIYSHMLDYFREQTVADDYIAFSYDAQNSSPQETTVSITYDSRVQTEKEINKRNKQQKGISEESGNMAQPSSMNARKEELRRNVENGIEDARVSLFDASISFGGSKENEQYVFTFAHSDSPVSENSRYLVYLGAIPLEESEDYYRMQVAAQISVKRPQLPLINFKDALNTDATTYMEGEINFNGSDNSKLSFQGILQRTEERKQYIRNHSSAFVCEQQMNQGNYFQRACLNITENANYLDKYDFSIDYRNVPEAIRDLGYRFYGLLRHLWYKYNNEDIVGVSGPEGKMNIGVRFAENLQMANISIDTPNLKSYFVNAPINNWAQPWLVQHPRYNQFDLLVRKFLYSEHYPTCSLDVNRASTFNNISYPVNLSDCYYVLAISTPQHYEDTSQEWNEEYDYYARNFAILVKGSQRKNVQVLLGNDAVSLESSETTGVSVKANGEKLQLSVNSLASWINGTNQVEVYLLPTDNRVVLYSRSHGLQLIYDGLRVQLSVSSHYRNKVRGLCGTFDGEPVNDFTAPGNCILRNLRDFIASYTIADDTCRGPAKNLYLQAKNAPCYPKETVFADVVLDSKVKRLSIKRENSHLSLTKSKKNCTSIRVMTLEDGERTCFSHSPQLHCSSHCKAVSKIEKTIDFICLPDSVATRHWVSMIMEGFSPDFSQKKSNHQMAVTLPDKCISQ